MYRDICFVVHPLANAFRIFFRRHYAFPGRFPAGGNRFGYNAKEENATMYYIILRDLYVPMLFCNVETMRASISSIRARVHIARLKNPYGKSGK